MIAVSGIDRGTFIQDADHLIRQTQLRVERGVINRFIRAWIHSRQQIAHRRAERVDIRSLVCLTDILLRRRKAFGAERNGIVAFIGLKDPRYTEVDDPQTAVGFHDHIGRLHITIDDRRRLMVQVGHRITQLNPPSDHPLLGLRTFFKQDFLQRLSLDIIHHQVERILILDDIDDTRKRGIVKILHHIGFMDQRVDIQAIVFIVCFDDLFDRPTISEPYVLRKIYNRHTAAVNVFD